MLNPYILTLIITQESAIKIQEIMINPFNASKKLLSKDQMISKLSLILLFVI